MDTPPVSSNAPNTGFLPREDLIQRCVASARPEHGGLLLCGQWMAECEDLETKLALARQVWDESRHTVAFYQRAAELGGDLKVDAAPSPVLDPLVPMLGQLDHLVLKTTWLHRCIESMAIESFIALKPLTDPDTQEMLDFIIADEASHVALGNTVYKRFATTPELQQRAALVQGEVDAIMARGRQQIARELASGGRTGYRTGAGAEATTAQRLQWQRERAEQRPVAVETYDAVMPKEELFDLLLWLRAAKTRVAALLRAWAADSPALATDLNAQALLAERHALALARRIAALGGDGARPVDDPDLEVAAELVRTALAPVERLAGLHRAFYEHFIARGGQLMVSADSGTQALVEAQKDEDEAVQRWGETLRRSLASDSAQRQAALRRQGQVSETLSRSRERLAEAITSRAARS